MVLGKTMPAEPRDPVDAQSASEGTADSFLRQVAGAEGAAAESHALMQLLAGDIVSDRFVIERLAGRGGMGVVYRALDRVTGAPVALKVMARPGRHDERFAQEARVLAALQHPAIVSYVAHGSTAHGHAYLAMLWLEGEDLARRLSRRGLTVAESLAVARRVAEGLSLAHARGLVHRDVKPSNLLLVQGDPARATLLDFGIVHTGLSGMAPTARPATRTGTVLGTVGYMSPEQAIADRKLDARSDVFALGCVLFECLTGQPAFSGEHVVAVLAKVLRAEVPRVRELRPELPTGLDDLVARMLAKEPTGRPDDGAAVLLELDALGGVTGGVPEAAAQPSPGLSGAEQRLVSLLLAAVPDDPDRLGAIVRHHAGVAARLANGALMVTWSESGSPSAQAIAAAACALQLRAAFPLARVALATGRARTTAGTPAGPVIDLAAALLARSTAPGIRIDEVTAGLLGERFEVGPGRELLAPRSDAEPPCTLLGRPTPCVGRDRELSLLELTLRECISDSVARAVVVNGPAGQGKSRLCHEFLVHARERRDLAIFMVRADPVAAGSAFVMVRQVVRQAIGLRESDPARQQQAELRRYLEEVCQGRDVARIADFLAELMRIPSIERPSPELRAALNDAQIMAAWLARSFGDWLAAECSRRPLLLVLEDLHWGDLPSVTYLGDALRALGTKPLMVLALARPEVYETFANLWAGAEKVDLALGRLAPRAAERLVRAVLGENTPGDVVARIVQRADGNAFYLEELIRRVAEGGGDTLPETVLALVQSRLERLEPEARRIVRAASVFGEAFWRGGVAALLGAAHRDEPGPWLDALSRGEMISSASDSRYPGEQAHVFRHGLLREAAYAMLTDADRITGHRLAGEWLERVGESDALTMANHFEKGGNGKRAVRWLVKAAQAALDGGHPEATIALVDRGIACGAEGSERGLLREAQGHAHSYLGNTRAGAEMALEAMQLLPVGSTQWFVSASLVLYAGLFLGDPRVMTQGMQAILDVSVQAEPSAPYADAVRMTSQALTLAGQCELADSLLKRAEAIGAGVADPDPSFVMYSRGARGFFKLATGDLGNALSTLSECRKLADQTGNALAHAVWSLSTIEALAETGACERAEAALLKLRSICEPRGLGIVVELATEFRDTAQVYAERAAEAIESLSMLCRRPNPFVSAIARGALAVALVQVGDLKGATREATVLLEQGAAFPTEQARACGAMSLVELHLGHAMDALGFAARGLEIWLRAPWPGTGTTLRLARAEALHALGRTGEAHIAIREARDVVLHTAATLDGDPELRESYLNTIHTHARTLQLAREWLGDGIP
jgi:hypothetical protein